RSPFPHTDRKLHSSASRCPLPDQDSPDEKARRPEKSDFAHRKDGPGIQTALPFGSRYRKNERISPAAPARSRLLSHETGSGHQNISSAPLAAAPYKRYVPAAPAPGGSLYRIVFHRLRFSSWMQ